MAHLIMTQGGLTDLQGLIDDYFGFGGAAGGNGGTYAGGQTHAQGYAGLSAIGAAILATITKNKTNKSYLENLKLGTETKPGTKTKQEQEYKPLEAIDEMIGRQELLIPPNAGTATKQEQEYKPLEAIDEMIGRQEFKPIEPIDKMIDKQEYKPIEPIEEMIGKQELPYLQNAITKPQLAEKTLPTIPPISEGLPSTEIKDETQTNVEQEISPTFDMQSMYDFILQQQQRQWEREDAIRKETQEREDNAYQRAVEDARKAGINVNLMGINPAQSGGGITQATGLDYTPFTTAAEKELALLEQAIEHAFQGDQKEKDRIVNLIGNVLKIFSIMSITSNTTITKKP